LFSIDILLYLLLRISSLMLHNISCLICSSFSFQTSPCKCASKHGSSLNVNDRGIFCTDRCLHCLLNSKGGEITEGENSTRKSFSFLLLLLTIVSCIFVEMKNVKILKIRKLLNIFIWNMIDKSSTSVLESMLKIFSFFLIKSIFCWTTMIQ
jgi:hypothetical protein